MISVTVKQKFHSFFSIKTKTNITTVMSKSWYCTEENNFLQRHVIINIAEGNISTTFFYFIIIILFFFIHKKLRRYQKVTLGNNFLNKHYNQVANLLLNNLLAKRNSLGSSSNFFLRLLFWPLTCSSGTLSDCYPGARNEIGSSPPLLSFCHVSLIFSPTILLTSKMFNSSIILCMKNCYFMYKLNCKNKNKKLLKTFRVLRNVLKMFIQYIFLREKNKDSQWKTKY